MSHSYYGYYSDTRSAGARKEELALHGQHRVKEKEMTSFFNKKTAPENFIKKTNTVYKSIPLINLKEKGIWNARLDKILPCLPKDAWIAGGFLRAMIAGEDDTNGDIDFFFHSEEGFDAMMDLIKYPSSVPGGQKAFNYYTIPEYENIKKLRIVDCESLVGFRPNVQLIRLYWFETPENVIDSFDFTICQFITDGKTLWFNPQAFDDVKTKTIREHRKSNDSITRLNRILKYTNKGYKAPSELFSEIEAEATTFLKTYKDITKYFYLDASESNIHKRSGSPLQHAWDYLETAPASAAAYAKVKRKDNKPKLKIDMPDRKNYTWDGS
jgi:hypothetical protein